MRLNGRTIGVTGATGFLGSHLVRDLAARGASVVGIVRNVDRGRWLEAHGVTLRKADLLDPESLTRAFEGLDAVVSNASLSLASLADADGDWTRFLDAERTGTTHAVQAALDAEVPRFVHISSVAVYRLTSPFGRVREDHPRRDTGGRFDLGHLVTRPEYAAGKALAEQIVWEAQARGLQPTVLRPGPIYGSRDPKLTQRYLTAMEQRIRWVPTLRLPHVHAGDVAAAAAGALANPASRGRAYNVTGEPVSILDVVRTLRRLRGAGPWLMPLPVPLSVGWDNTAARDDLGVEYRSIEDGMREVVAHHPAAS